MSCYHRASTMREGKGWGRSQDHLNPNTEGSSGQGSSPPSVRRSPWLRMREMHRVTGSAQGDSRLCVYWPPATCQAPHWTEAFGVGQELTHGNHTHHLCSSSLLSLIHGAITYQPQTPQGHYRLLLLSTTTMCQFPSALKSVSISPPHCPTWFPTTVGCRLLTPAPATG